MKTRGNAVSVNYTQQTRWDSVDSASRTPSYAMLNPIGYLALMENLLRWNGTCCGLHVCAFRQPTQTIFNLIESNQFFSGFMQIARQSGDFGRWWTIFFATFQPISGKNWSIQSGLNEIGSIFKFISSSCSSSKILIDFLQHFSELLVKIAQFWSLIEQNWPI